MITTKLKNDYDYLAPDGSEIRLLPKTSRGGLAHCTLLSGKTSHPVKHKTVEEIWYILEGVGEIWRKYEGKETIVNLQAGTCLTISTGVEFQFRNIGKEPLRILLSTMPPWPGKDEAVPVKGCW